MAAADLVKEMIEAGIHYGHRASRWNPKMKPYIFGKRNLIHIINIKETLRGLLLAKKFITRVVGEGKDIVIVGTKRQARKSVQERADEVNMHWVIDRWLGGTLTNFREIRKRVGRLEELEQLEADGMLDAYSKKEGASLRREMRKIHRNLGGIRKMTRLPGAVVVIDQRREIIAVREAIKIKIPVICLLDTDSDPDMVDIPIPGNDDAMRGIDIIVRELCRAVTEGIVGRTDKADEPESAPQRRSSRPTMGRADPAMDTTSAPAPAPQPPAAVPAAAPVEPAPAAETPAPVAAQAPIVEPPVTGEAPAATPAPAAETPAAVTESPAPAAEPSAEVAEPLAAAVEPPAPIVEPPTAEEAPAVTPTAAEEPSVVTPAMVSEADPDAPAAESASGLEIVSPGDQGQGDQQA